MSLLGSNLPFKTILSYIDELQKIIFGNCKSKIGTCSSDVLISTSFSKRFSEQKWQKAKSGLRKRKEKRGLESKERMIMISTIDHHELKIGLTHNWQTETSGLIDTILMKLVIQSLSAIL